ncbi:MAG: hypothetical protein DYG83_13250 [Candidatus Brocadia sp. AMX2]|uniref:Uncharacterized protein n=1 Tax=Candidatus Brocadia sinica JPN1 TaxID=1197129 RepID=A0ABQ0JZ03_9BACT|nr:MULTISPECIES: hypothetical protein [Brocadia]MBC6932213.1 hypothetical protein [Candidatus Brocadia sp.]MBL1168485.1 hypothetical protein [Candidatus Brocadia sp. AMX1]NOG40231.1 hypothetical protein [Planctomycetota bacterium]NUQ57685.1 hypothetical protein [Candidatus Paceibacter sp.]GIK14209.1 MAG: hypothetical protein BroJett002_29160 [Candidatus Brocadia sinica]
MSNIETAVKGFKLKQKEVVFAGEKLTELTRRGDDVRENLPRLERNVESVRAQREQIVDKLILNTVSRDDFGKNEEFRKVQKSLEDAEKAVEGERLISEAVSRQIKKIESELPRLHTQVQLAERRVWETISAEFESQISDDIKETVTTIVAIGAQTGRTRQFILDCLFPNPSSGETQEIQKGLREEYSLID